MLTVSLLITLVNVANSQNATTLFEEYFSTVPKYDDVKLNFLHTNARLFDDVFSHYNRFIPPVVTKTLTCKSKANSLAKTQIDVTLVYAKLLEVNPPRQMMTIIFDYLMVWKDERLAWDPALYDGINHMYVLREKVWIPEITAFDSSGIIDTRPNYKQYAGIEQNGLVHYYQSTVAAVSCVMNVVNFPFDIQNCSVNMVSRLFQEDEIELKNDIFNTIQFDYVGNAEWSVMNVTTNLQLMFENETANMNQYVFIMKRNPSFYIALIIVPSFVLAFLCIAGMFCSALKVDDIDKINMGLTTLTSFGVMMSILSDSIPKTEDPPKLSRFVTMNLIVVSGAIGMAIIVPKVGHIIHGLLRRICCCCNEKNWFLRHLWILGGLVDFLLLLIFEYMIISNMLNLFSNEEVLRYFGVSLQNMKNNPTL